ncbi:hypothetical protein [Nonomuraea roseoviolacea]|uniref:Uncharacterized protein n=1 Tax=Nonomuraea roseoviolacea subsp. carminata TaxID=160689 RepID=A0ABT1JX94_9ACTN|nr:hypothetical protein [Nonomuraea roseoviolacea]MCP2346340.1 hypothetical protein [Nonomuraea roseoviolacea subsp. carminata]
MRLHPRDLPLGDISRTRSQVTTLLELAARVAEHDVENQQTGDGRSSPPGALYWDGPGPWPLQYADEMLAGHDGAELAGAIETLARDGDRIPATGVLYPSQAAGASAIRLLQEGAPLGVSIDPDDIDVELIDRRPPAEHDEGDAPDEEGEEVIMLASLTAAGVLPLPDGSH